jgi:hypothetical protein
MIAFALDREMLRAVDATRGASGVDRSTFIRDAIVRELERKGIPAKRSWIKPPDRTRPNTYGPSSSKVDKAAKDIGKSVLRKARRPRRPAP